MCQACAIKGAEVRAGFQIGSGTIRSPVQSGGLLDGALRKTRAGNMIGTPANWTSSVSEVLFTS
jgi:hypothetical protein